MALSVACTGLVDNGEDIEVAAVREVLEETGVHVKFEGVRVCVCVCVRCVLYLLQRKSIAPRSPTKRHTVVI